MLLPLSKIRGFYVFPLLHPPLDIDAARSCLFSFAKSAFHSIEELHSVGFAHTDIRLPNFCFKQSEMEWSAVLIDLDCAVDLSKKISANVSSHMYNVQFDRAEQYDWRQYALMLCRIIEGKEGDYHTREPHFGCSHAEVCLMNSFRYGIKPKVELLDLNH